MSPDPVKRETPPPRCVLAIGTSTEWCTVALRYRDRTGRPRADALGERAGQEHSRRVLAMADSLLGAAGLGVEDLGAIAFDAGPGSFTGLRIGCGVAQGLGFALARPLVPVASLEALAYQALGVVSGATLALVALDARMGEVYCAAYRLRGGDVAPLGPIRVLAPQAAFDRMLGDAGDAGEVGEVGEVGEAVAIGNAFARYDGLAAAAHERGIVVRPDPYPRGDAIAAIGAMRFASGATVEPSAAAPIYVRDKVALDVDEQLRQRARRDGAQPLAAGADADR